MSVKQTERKITALYERLSRDDDNACLLYTSREKSFNLYSYRGSIIFKHLILIIARVFSQQIICLLYTSVSVWSTDARSSD